MGSLRLPEVEGVLAALHIRAWCRVHLGVSAIPAPSPPFWRPADYNRLMVHRSVLLPLALLTIAALSPCADLNWRRITIDRSQKGKWAVSAVVLEARPANALTRAAARGMRVGAMRRMGRYLQSARQEWRAGAPAGSYYFSEDPKVYFGTPSLISVVVESDSFEGGAHPYAYPVFENWAMVRGKPKRLGLADLLRHGLADVAKVSMLVIGKLRSNENAMWVQNGEVRELTPETRDSFAITKRGLDFIFAPYVMGPYSSGEITVDLSWRELQGIVDPNRVLGPALAGTRNRSRG